MSASSTVTCQQWHPFSDNVGSTGCLWAVLSERGLILNDCGFERDDILIECGHETALFSGRAIDVVGLLQVGRNPRVVTRETFTLKGHNLHQLAQQAMPTLSKPELNILYRLSEFVKWAGRYPIHLYAAENIHPSYIPSTDPDLVNHLFTKFVALLEQENPTSKVKFIPE